MPATRPGAPGQSSTTSNAYFHDLSEASAANSEASESERDGSEVFDEQDGDLSESVAGGEEEEEQEGGEEEPFPESIGLHRIDTLSSFSEELGAAEVSPDAGDAAADAAPAGEVPPVPGRRLSISAMSTEAISAASDYLATTLGAVETPRLAGAAPAAAAASLAVAASLPLRPARGSLDDRLAKQSGGGGGASCSAGGDPPSGLPLSVCRVDTLDLLQL
eukprot:CAMPEP_0185347940 /NCGR_PEP_ID=MMETSP1364-20130426/1455_1 /TAXON_ID=38817 /ORGANISM="Gephyrocapsa oceanica, Strain RCC1303" /LENGTH=218 /DNA_ID=CAMNT_0027947347 /DNA_START=50 /DNA_END=703 /DNA_ORIENTATION=+